MKKVISYFITSMFIFMTFLSPTFAATATIHYRTHPEEYDRTPTYTNAKPHLQTMGYTVYGYENSNNTNILNQLDSTSILVMHLHGLPGVQAMANSTYLSGTNGNGGYIKAVNSLSSGSLNQMKIAIYYGCETGVVSATYGDICQETVNKGAQAAVAWEVSTIIPDVNEWNRLFFEKAKTDNIVESFRHADYWLRYMAGDDAGDRMQITRNEKGNIYGYIN